MQVQADKKAEIVDQVDGDDAEDAHAAQGVKLPDAIVFLHGRLPEFGQPAAEAVGNLADQGLGKLGAELDVVRHGIFGDMLAAVIEDLLLDGVRRLAAGAQDDEGLDLLHLIRVLDADDAGQEDLFVAVDDVFQLAGIDVIAGGDDHALDALGEVDKAVLVHLAKVAGVQPDAAVVVAAEGVMGLLGIVDVLEHDGGAGDADLALEIGVELLRGAGLDDLVVGIGERDADGADAVIILRGQAGGRDALGQAVALTDLHGGMVHFQELVDLLLELDGHAVAAGEDALQAAEVGVFELFGAQKGLKQGRDAGDDVRLLLDEQVGVGIDVELRDEDAARAADEGGMDADAEAEAVEHGHDGEHLQPAGGTAGIEDGRAVFRAAVVLRQGQIALFAHALELGPPDVIAVLRGLRILARGGEGVAEGQMRIELVLNFGEQELAVLVVKLGHDGGDLGVELVEREDALGVREVEVELDLARGGKRMDHVGDRADAVEAVERACGQLGMQMVTRSPFWMPMARKAWAVWSIFSMNCAKVVFLPMNS